MFRLVVCCFSLLVQNILFSQFGDPTFDLVEQGIVLQDQGKHKQAIEKYNQALQLDKKNAMALYEKGIAYFSLSQYKKALGLANKIIKYKDPSYLMDAYILKADAYEKLGKRNLAIQVYEEATSLYSKSSFLSRKLGLRYMKMGYHQKAHDILIESIYLDHLSAQSHKALANVLLRNGSFIKGFLVSLRTMNLDPDIKDGLDILNVINSDLEEKFLNDKDSTISFEKIGLKHDINSSVDNLINRFEYYINGLSKKSENDFYWNYYVDFYKNIVLQGYTEVFIYKLISSVNNSAYSAWISNPSSQSELEQFNTWMNRYDWPDLNR